MSRTQERVNKTQGRGRKMQKRFFWGRDADAEGGGGGVEDAEEAATQRLLLRFGFEWRVVALCCGKAELAQDQDEAYGKDGKEGRVRVVRRCKWRDWPHFIFREAQP